MIFKKLKLQNIRSYKQETIDFPLGKTLFEGNIGCGKSTLLMALEFALFGLGSEKGGALLRAGESEGKVSLAFEVDGREYVIQRGLERKRTSVQQTEGVIKTPEGLLHLSPTELKEKVLEILNFNEPADPKAQSVIYRYAVFTPQEEMKTILFSRPDVRLQTLRKAFRIEDYKIATQNAEEVSAAIELKASEYAGAAADVPELKKKVEELGKQIKEKEKELVSLEGTRRETDKSLKGLKEERESLHAEEVQLAGVKTEIEHLEELIRDKTKEVKDSKEEAEGLQGRLKQLEPRLQQLEGIKKPTDKAQEELQADIENVEENERTLRESKTRIDTKIAEYKSVEENDVCPTCDRPAKPEEFADKIMVKNQERQRVSGRLTELLEALKKTKELLKKRKEYDDAQEKLRDQREKVTEYRAEAEKRSKKIASATKETEEADKKLKAAKKSLERLHELSAKLKELANRIEAVEGDLRKVGEKISGATARIQGWQREIEGHTGQIEKKEKLKAKSETLKEYRIWLDDYFVPTLDAIEKHVMLSINQEFNSHFQKWFGDLIEDAGKEARIDEAFTPIVDQDGYDQDVAYLSGGEKTSVALAYRLALNKIVQKVSTGMSSNLLILDEPTDGFSKEQLGKVREILDELECPQIIIVSHERELESFADQIYRITKGEGGSKVVAGAT